MVWLISGIDLPTIEIKADSFDEAIKQARELNPRYDAGQVKGR